MPKNVATCTVAYALPDKQVVLEVALPAHCNARKAIALSGISKLFPEIDIDKVALGIFGRSLERPELYQVQAGDRIEIYRPLTVDAKTRRLLRDQQS